MAAKNNVVQQALAAALLTTAMVVAAPDVVAQQGVQAGSFLILPRAEATAHYNDNIYTTGNQRTSDQILQLSPSVAARSNFDQHAINFSASLDQGLYRRHSDNNFTDYALATDGRLDLWQGGNVFAGAAHRQLHEDRGSPNNANGKEPVVYTVTTLSGGLSQQYHAFGIRAELKSDKYNYNDVARQGLADDNNDDRDRRETSPSLRLGYAATQNLEVFTRGAANKRQYINTIDDNGFRRSSDGYEAVAGVGLGFPGLFTGEFFGGYMAQNYDDTRFGTIRTPKAGWNLEYVPMPRLAVRSNANRTIDETTTSSASGLITSSVSLSADYDLTRDMIIRPEVTYVHQKYAETRQRDRLWNAGISLVYSITDNFYAGPTYRWRSRDSNVNDSDYHANIVMLRFGAQM